MALIFADSFDHYATAQRLWKYTTEGGGSDAIAAGGRNGTTAFSYNQNGHLARVFAGSTATTWIAGCWWKLTSAVPSAAQTILSFGELASGLHVELRINPSGFLIVTRNGTQIGTTGSTLFSSGTEHYLEFKATAHDTTGSFEVRVDEVTEISATNVDTRNAGTPVFDRLWIGSISSTGSITALIDDLYLCDSSGSVNNNFLGDVRVASLLPSGAGTTTQFTPSAGSNYQNVDDAAPDSDTTYNSSTTPGNIDTFAMADLPSSAATVHGIQHLTVARKDDAGARTLRQVIRSGGSNYEGSNITLPDAYNVFFMEVRETNPATATAWTGTTVDAVEAGYKDQA